MGKVVQTMHAPDCRCESCVSKLKKQTADLKAELEVVKENLETATHNYHTHAELNAELQAKNKRVIAKSDEVHRNAMWVALELGKALRKRYELEAVIKALKE